MYADNLKKKLLELMPELATGGVLINQIYSDQPCNTEHDFSIAKRAIKGK